ncbi:unnamed protein product [Prunus armeniaca]
MGCLLHLQHLNLSMNSFGGEIPTNISLHAAESAHLSLGGNNLQGSIRNELGRLKSLGSFRVGRNNLSGMVPASIYNISSIYIFGVTQNQLHRELPPNAGITLPNLQVFVGGANSFTRNIPASLSNASGLQVLDFARNGFTGKLPGESFGKLQSLVKLNFDENRLGSGKAEVLGLIRNHFEGEFPGSIANLSTQLKIPTLGVNMIHGSIPRGIGVNLSAFGVEGNDLGGSVPSEIGKL